MVGYDDQTVPYVYKFELTSETTIAWRIEIQGTWTINFDYTVCAQQPVILT